MIKRPDKLIIARPFFCYGLAFGAGIALGGTGLISPVMAIAALGLGAVLWLGRYKSWGYFAPVALVFALGLLWMVSGVRSPASFPVEKGEDLEMQVLVIDSKPNRNGYTLEADPYWVNGSAYRGGQVLIYVDDSVSYAYGDILLVKGSVLSLRQYGNENAFNYEDYLWRQGITAVISGNYGGEAVKVGTEKRNLMLVISAKLRDRLEQGLAYLTETQQNYVKGVYLGEKTGLSAYEKRILSETGLLHAFAVSGLHVGYIAGVAGMLLGKGYRRRWPRFWLGAFLIGFYLCLAGFMPSVLRASIMAFLVLLAPAIHEKSDLLNSWGIAVVLILLGRPVLLYDASFQLSFISVLGIGLLMPVFQRILPGKGWFRDSLAVTLSASFGSMPVIAWYFQLSSLAGWILSPLLLVLIGFVVILGLLATFICIFSPWLSSLPLIGAGLIMEFVYFVSEKAASLSFSWIALLKPSALILGLYYLLMVLVARGLKTTKKWAYWLGIGAMFLVLLLPLGTRFGSNLAGIENAQNNLLEVVFLDVGNGDSCVVFTPQGNTLVIDGGGKQDNPFSMGENVVSPYLRSRGVSEIGLLINSHPHADHIGGLFPLLELFEVKEAMLSAACEEVPLQLEFRDKAMVENCRIIPARAGDSFLLEENLFLTVYAPFAGTAYGDEQANQGSLVMKLSYGEVDFLFTGDLEGESLREISGYPIEAEVLKLPHHGSVYSLDLDFYAKIAPKAVVVCVGENSYGHPSYLINDFWLEQGVPYYRTDKNGAVTFWTDGLNLRVETVY